MDEHLDVRVVPVALYILLPVSFVTLYFWGTSLNHFNEFLPFISDLGARAPEDGLFAETCAISAVLFALTFYFRYLLLRDFADGSKVKNFRALLITNLALGFTGAFGITLVGNYSELFIDRVHSLGALMILGLGVVYEWIDVHLTIHTEVLPTRSRTRVVLRIILASCSTIALVFMETSSYLSYYNRVVEPKDVYERLHWTREMGGFQGHLVSAFSEWILLLSELLYFGTFIPEFKCFRLPYPFLVAVDPALTPLRNPERLVEREEGEPLLKSNKIAAWNGSYGALNTAKSQ